MVRILKNKKLLLYIASFLLLSFLPIHSFSEDSSIQVTNKNIETEISSKSKDLTNPTDKKIEKNWNVDRSINLLGIFVAAFINLLGIFVAACLIIWQMRRQHRSSVDLQRENYREKLRIQIYEELVKKIEKASSDNISIGATALTLILSLKSYIRLLEQGISPSPIREREPEIRSYHNDALKSLANLIITLENFEIINPNLNVFRWAFSAAHHDIMEAFKPFHLELLKYLPHDVPEIQKEQVGSNIIIPKVPTTEELKEFSKISSTYHEAISEAGCYIHDLRIEAQNIFLGKLFKNEVPSRKPIDPKHIVITTQSKDEVDKLEKYFKKKLNWGKINRLKKN